MGDLQNSLLKPNINRGKGFFGKFQYLNTLFDNNHYMKNSENMFLKIQKNELEAIVKKENFSEVNDFLERMRSKNAFDNDEETIEEGLIQINKLLNKAFKSGEDTIRSKENLIKIFNDQLIYDKNVMKDAGETILNDIEKIARELKLNGSIKKETVYALRAFLRSGKAKKRYIEAKAAQMESLFVDAANTTGFFALNTSAFTDYAEQLIEDAMVFDNRNVSLLKEGESFFTVTLESIKKNKKNKTTKISTVGELQDFLSKAGKEYKIHINDSINQDLYERLKKSALFSVQTKSGVGYQSILNSNSNKRNAISLEKIDVANSRGESLLGLYHLYELQYQPGGGAWFRDEENQVDSNTMSMLANYCLSKNIIKTNLIQNELYMTSHGLKTAAEWINESQKSLRFSPPITKLTRSIYTENKPYRF